MGRGVKIWLRPCAHGNVPMLLSRETWHHLWQGAACSHHWRSMFFGNEILQLLRALSELIQAMRFVQMKEQRRRPFCQSAQCFQHTHIWEAAVEHSDWLWARWYYTWPKKTEHIHLLGSQKGRYKSLLSKCTSRPMTHLATMGQQTNSIWNSLHHMRRITPNGSHVVPQWWNEFIKNVRSPGSLSIFKNSSVPWVPVLTQCLFTFNYCS